MLFYVLSLHLLSLVAFSSFLSLSLFLLKTSLFYEDLVLAGLYKDLGERGNEMENAEYQTRKTIDLQRRIADANASIYHLEIVS